MGGIQADDPLTAGLLKLDEPLQFLASIQGFNQQSKIELTHTQVTSAHYSEGVLDLLHGQQIVAKLDIPGNFTTNEFAITNRGGNAFVTLNRSPPAASVVASASGSQSTHDTIPIHSG